MNLFLDTHIVLWWLDDNPQLSIPARHGIMDTGNVIIVSAAVIWEIRIKQALGKLQIDPGFYKVIQQQGFELLPITADHAFAVGNLPTHHRDPFDRIIIAQTIFEGFTLVTHDDIFQKYGIPIFPN